jgi:cystathionine beta-lyase
LANFMPTAFTTIMTCYHFFIIVGSLKIISKRSFSTIYQIMPGHKHTVFANISEELANNMIVCTAPSKTFNLAGLQTSNIIIPNEIIRSSYLKEMKSNGFFSLNILGYKACEIAYTECEKWLEQLLALIYHNHLELKTFMAKNIPVIKVFDLEGTYLQWMDGVIR